MEVLFIIGRIILGIFFIFSGVNHFAKFKMMVGYSKSKNVPLAGPGVVVTGIMLMVGGLGILAWFSVPIAALILIIFLLPTTIWMHAFWKETSPQEKMTQMRYFMGNMALVGALLIIWAMY